LSQRKKGVVLMYHRVLDDAEISATIHPGMYVTRRTFGRHLEYLSEKYQVLTLQEIGEWVLGKRESPKKTPCAITFDDGWVDNYHHAFPLLQAYGVPATIFVITNQIGGVGMLTWDQIREMEKGGISVGSHTVTHTVLTTLNQTEIREELAISKEKLKRELDHPSDWFCYPKGQFSEEIVGLAKEYYAGAVVTGGGSVVRGDALFQLQRIGMHEDVSWSIPLFACRVATIF
jgi:peptidoglycan/xylan/chitin deacetylase (PgdA/CDA1 family)